eukprot:10173810-Prorocentrum_lima.AAC.1
MSKQLRRATTANYRPCLALNELQQLPPWPGAGEGPPPTSMHHPWLQAPASQCWQLGRGGGP